MSHPKPPPQTLQPDDERTVQIFLERASSIVLERPVLDLTHWRRLVALAEELGMSDEQLRDTVNDLRQRGVIAEIDLSPPKPPPLPSRAQQDRPQQEETTPQPSAPDRDFSLTPPAPPPPPPSAATPARDNAPTAKNNSTTSAPPPTPSSNGPTHEQRLQIYLERAKHIVAEQRGFGPRAQSLLAAAAQELNLTEQDTAEVLRSMAKPVQPPMPPPPPGEKQSTEEAELNHRRWRVEGAPPPEPPPPPKKPAEIYRDYLSASMAQITDGKIPALLERKFVRHGTSVLGLAKTFAQHIVTEEAAAKNLRIEESSSATSDDHDEPASSTDDGELFDTNVKMFLERSVPILAQHRGINAKSRVLLNALAGEFGLSDQQVDSAIAASQLKRDTTQVDADTQQQERLVGFRELVEGALISLPRKLLTFDVEENLARHGEERHGIQPALVAAAIRDVCNALEIRQISEQQAREHIEQLVDAKLGEHSRLSEETRSRIESEGKQWGLSEQQVVAIVKEQTRLRDQRNRSEQNFTHGALLAACLAALMVAGFFGWVVIQSNAPKPIVAEVEREAPSLPAPTIVEDDEVDTSWWGEDLQFTIGNARREIRSLRPALIKIESNVPSTRESAYREVSREAFDESLDDVQQDMLLQIMALCYARDPDQNTSRKLLDDVLSHIPRSERDLRRDDELYPHAFVATGAAIEMVTSSTDQRQRDAADELGLAIGRTIDTSQPAEAIEQHAFEGVAERLFRLLIAFGKREPTLVASAHKAVAQQANKYIRPTTLEKLNTDFLVAVLRRDEEASVSSQVWRDYRDLIQATVASGSAINVMKMLDIFGKTKDADLRSMLSKAFVTRIDSKPESNDVATVAAAVRKSFGVTPKEVDNKRLTRFLVGAEDLLMEPAASMSEPEAVLLEIVNFAYQSTLGCAVAQGSSGDTSFDTLVEQDPEEFLVSDEPTVLREPIEPNVLEPGEERSFNDRLQFLRNSRVTVDTRVDSVEYIARLTSSTDDISPIQAAVLATYLLTRKRVEEHERVMEYVPELATWKQLRLAVADLLEEVEKKSPQLEEVAANLLGRDYTLAEGAAWRDTLRIDLLNNVLADAKKEDVADEDKHQVFNDAAQTLYDLYATQAILFQVPEWPNNPTTATVILKAMLEKRLPLLRTKSDSDDLTDEVKRLQSDLLAVDYLATNDLQKLALLDRLWLRLLAVDVMLNQPDRQPQAQALVNQLAVSDRKANHVLAQIRNSQKAILQMWLLLNKPN